MFLDSVIKVDLNILASILGDRYYIILNGHYPIIMN